MNSNPQIPESGDPLGGALDFQRYLPLLWHWAWVIAGATLIACAAAFVVSKVMTPIYQAKSVVLVNEAPSNKSLDVSTLQLSSQLTQTYSQMMTKSGVLEKVATQLAIPEIDPKTIVVTPVANTQLISITVESPNPAVAVSIANTLVTVFSDEIQSLQNARFSSSEQSLQPVIQPVDRYNQPCGEEQGDDPRQRHILNCLWADGLLGQRRRFDLGDAGYILRFCQANLLVALQKVGIDLLVVGDI